jgi:hypothetical protein
MNLQEEYPMINVHVNLDLENPNVVRDRTVKIGEIFPIVLYVEHGGLEEADVVFDTLILEVFFNDSEDAIVRVDPTDRPVVGCIAARSRHTMDAFRRTEVVAPETLTMKNVTECTPLSLYGFDSLEPAGPFHGRSGRAGICNLRNPFRLQRGAAPISVAAGKAEAGLLANKTGSTRVIGNGIAFLNGETIPVKSVPSVVTIVSSDTQAVTRISRKPLASYEPFDS